jgi:tripartite-type tricarboxylate transporter receptor subunit TctC
MAGARRRGTPVLLVAAALGFALAGAPTSQADDSARDFYRSRTLRIVVGFPPGGGFDLYARTVAEFLPRHLPGDVRAIVENMPGASTARAASYVYNVGPQDGTVLGIFHQGLLANQVLDVKAGDFDVTRFNWIGRMGTQLNVGLVWHTSPVKSIEDAKKTEVVYGATAPSATSAMVPRAINNIVGTKFKIVLGYQGSTDMYLAMERGETEGMATGVWYDLTREHQDWLKSGKVGVLFQISTKRVPDLTEVPALPDLAPGKEENKILELLASTEDMGRAFAAGPKVPADRVAFLRAGFAKMMQDPDFLRESAKRYFEINFLPGEELQDLVAKVGRFPPELRNRAREIIQQ